jgi:hypothetical protein
VVISFVSWRKKTYEKEFYTEFTEGAEITEKRSRKILPGALRAAWTARNRITASGTYGKAVKTEALG